ncbi:MAG: glycine cleavage system protein R [Pseudomonadota bacterium]|jgi:glycine cleavage system transcriptional repressor|nr:glycine cleavage system protein R [Pseudomonadota bacterium]
MSTQSPTTINQLVLSALGGDKPGLIDELSRCILNSGCNIVDSRMTVLGGDFAILLLVDGNWNNIAKLENQITQIEERLDLTITARRTTPKGIGKDLLPYGVDVVALDHPGIVHNLAGFFSKRQINIQEMTTSSYSAAHTGTPMFSVHLMIDIPATLQISVLREEFMDFCDQLNLDAVIEPVKG